MSVTAHADNLEGKLGVPLEKVFERVLIAAEEKKFEKVKNALKLLDPIAQEVNQELGINIKAQLEEAVNAGERDQIIHRTQQFVFFTIKILLSGCHQYAADRSHMAPLIREAYALYLVLDYYVQKKDFLTAQDMKLAFRQANMTVGVKAEEFKSVCSGIKGTLEHFFIP